VGEAKEGRVFLFLVVSQPGGGGGGRGAFFLFVAGYLCVCVFGFGFVARLSSIGNRQEGRFLERFARDRERARVMVFCVAEMGEENK
jgi:hypothetical protein